MTAADRRAEPIAARLDQSRGKSRRLDPAEDATPLVLAEISVVSVASATDKRALQRAIHFERIVGDVR